MSIKSGKTIKRMKVETYKGFSIIKVKTTHYWYYGGYYRDIVDHISTHFEFCKEGDETRPSMAIDRERDTLSDCKALIDEYIKDNTFFYTKAEYHKYVLGPNYKNDWGFNREMLLTLIRAWKRGDKHIKYLYEERLTDANYHSLCGILSTEGYDKGMEWIDKNFPKRD